MIDTLLNLLFRCAHRHLTRPITPVSKAGIPHGETYVVCLDCAKQFAYDLKEMRIGKAIEHPHDACVLPSNMPTPGRTKVKYALGMAVPGLGIALPRWLNPGLVKFRKQWALFLAMPVGTQHKCARKPSPNRRSSGIGRGCAYNQRREASYAQPGRG